MRRTRGIRFEAVCADSAVDWDHPLNTRSSARRLGWWATPSGIPAAGSRLLNLCGHDHGTLTGGATWVRNSPCGPAIALDGSTGYVAFPALSYSTSGPMSVAAWVQVASSGMFGQIMTKCDSVDTGARNYLLDTGIDGLSVRFAVYDSGGAEYVAASGVVMTAGSTWARLVGVFDGTNVICYSNGVVQDTQPGPGSSLRQIGDLAIGRLGGSSANYLNGTVADASVWNFALTPTQVLADYQLSLERYQAPNSPLRWVSAVSEIASGTATTFTKLVGGGGLAGTGGTIVGPGGLAG